jgi:tripartite ATP-independent transporter DctM subunit
MSNLGLLETVVPETSGPPKKSSLLRVQSWVDHVFHIVTAIAVIGELLIMLGNVIVRTLFNSSILWSNEVGTLSLIVIAFVGGAIAYPRGEHVSVEVLIKYLPLRIRETISIIANWIVVGTSLLCAILAMETAIEHIKDKSLILQISQSWFTLPIIVGMLLFTFYALVRITTFPSKKTTLITGAILAIVVVLTMMTKQQWMGYVDDTSVLVIALTSFVMFLFIGIPIGFTLAAASSLYLYLSNKVPMTAIPLTMENAIMNFVLLAIPFFILTGYLMTEGGLSKRLVDVTMSIVGRVRGGLLQVIVVVTYIVSGLSGSKVADVAAVGSTMKEALDKEGYHPGEGAAVLASSAIMGETIPPSIAMLVLGSITTLSVGTLFVAGLLPAVVLAVCLMILISIRARKAGMKKGRKVPLKETAQMGLKAFPAFLAPIMLIGGIIGGIGTPTEVSSVAVIYTLLIGVIVYRGINFKNMWEILIESCAKAGMVLFIVTTASAFSWSLTVAQVPHDLAMLMSSLGGSSTVFMLITIIVLIIMGAMLEGLPAILIFGPLLLPIAPQFGINPLQYGMVLIISMGLGSFLPPIGVGSYVCVAIMKTTIEDTLKHMLPYIVFLLIGILLIAFIPWFSLVLPQAFHLIK